MAALHAAVAIRAAATLHVAATLRALAALCAPTALPAVVHLLLGEAAALDSQVLLVRDSYTVLSATCAAFKL